MKHKYLETKGYLYADISIHDDDDEWRYDKFNVKLGHIGSSSKLYIDSLKEAKWFYEQLGKAIALEEEREDD